MSDNEPMKVVFKPNRFSIAPDPHRPEGEADQIRRAWALGAVKSVKGVLHYGGIAVQDERVGLRYCVCGSTLPTKENLDCLHQQGGGFETHRCYHFGAHCEDPFDLKKWYAGFISELDEVINRLPSQDKEDAEHMRQFSLESPFAASVPYYQKGLLCLVKQYDFLFDRYGRGFVSAHNLREFYCTTLALLKLAGKIPAKYQPRM